MNRRIGRIAALVNALTVLCFAVCLLNDWTFGSYFVCIFLSISFVCMAGAFYVDCSHDRKAAGIIGLAFAGVYAALIMIVYFTQCTTVSNEPLTQEAARILDYRRMGLMFNLDLLGYGIMALSTFFLGLAVRVRRGEDKVLKALLLGHGLFFPACLILPMTGMFLGSDGSTSQGGVLALEIWCLYFLPVGILSCLHFRKAKEERNG